MAKKTLDIRNYMPQANETFLLDTSVLIPVFTEMDIAFHQESYAKFFYEILKKKKIKPVITTLLLSELFNRYLQFHFKSYCKSNNLPHLNFKRDYRTTSDYTEKMKAIVSIAKEDIFPFFLKVDDGFKCIDTEKLLEIDTFYDFNDKMIAGLCISNNYTLITDDADFGQMRKRPKILTANSALLVFQ